MFQSKSSMPRAALAALFSAPLVLLTACGGGGGGDESGAPVGAPLVISSANAKAVSADALGNATNVEAAGAGTSFVTGVQVGAVGGAAGPLKLAAAVRVLVAKVPAGPALATGVAINETLQCELGGSVTLTGNVASETGVSAGDTVNISASNCRDIVDGVPTTMSGAMKLTIIAGTFDPNVTTFPRRLAMRMDASNFTVSADGETSAVNGDLTIDMNESSALTGTIVLSGSSLSSAVLSASGTSRSYSLADYRQAMAFANSNISFEVSATVTTTNARLGTGALTYTVSTPTTLVTNAAGQFTGGSLRVAGSNSSLQLTVTAADTFQIQVDPDGDGDFDDTTTSTLAELRSLL